MGADIPSYELIGTTLRIRFHALESALIDQPKTPKRQNDVLDDVLADRIIKALKEAPQITQKELVLMLDVPYRTLQRNGELFMTDGGGENTVLHQIKRAGYDWMDIRHIFVTHKHLDHLMGIIWMVRMICQFMNHGEYKGEAFIYSHKEVLDLIRERLGITRRVVQKYINTLKETGKIEVVGTPPLLH